mgnify:CR=1 FL=1
MAKRKRKKKTKSVPSQFLGVHNQALFNSQRDIKIAQSIKTRMKEDETLTQVQIKDLEKRRKELMK